MTRRVWILLGAILVAVFVVYLLPGIPQSEAYYNFADTRALLGIPNVLNAASNISFLLVGLLGCVISCEVRASLTRVSAGRIWYFSLASR